MCIITVCNSRKLTMEEFTKCWDSNSDGVGIAWGINGTVYIKKGLMHMKRAWEYYDTYVDNIPHVVHFRLASSGTICKELTHPYIISPDSPSVLDEVKTTFPVLFHNGTFLDWKHSWVSMILDGMPIDGRMNDSRLIAMICGKAITNSSIVAKKYVGVLPAQYVLESMGGKHAIVDKTGEITIIGDFKERKEKGVLYSSEPVYVYRQNNYDGRSRGKWDYEKQAYVWNE
jgi:hypothetical protein